MKRVIAVLTALFLVGGFVSLSVNDRALLRDLRYSGITIWNRLESIDEISGNRKEYEASADYLETVSVAGEQSSLTYEGINAELRFVREPREDFDIRYEVTKGSGTLEMESGDGRLRIREVPDKPGATTVFAVTVAMPETYREEIRVKLVNGGIYADELTSPVTLETVNADVALTMAAAVPVSIKNVNGALTIGYDADSMKDLRYDFRVTNGMISVQGEPQVAVAGAQNITGSFGNGTTPLEIETTNGIITLDEK